MSKLHPSTFYRVSMSTLLTTDGEGSVAAMHALDNAGVLCEQDMCPHCRSTDLARHFLDCPVWTAIR